MFDLRDLRGREGAAFGSGAGSCGSF